VREIVAHAPKAGPAGILPDDCSHRVFEGRNVGWFKTRSVPSHFTAPFGVPASAGLIPAEAGTPAAGRDLSRERSTGQLNQAETLSLRAAETTMSLAVITKAPNDEWWSRSLWAGFVDFNIKISFELRRAGSTHSCGAPKKIGLIRKIARLPVLLFVCRTRRAQTFLK
jgi:hypothetical protein